MRGQGVDIVADEQDNQRYYEPAAGRRFMVGLRAQFQ